MFTMPIVQPPAIIQTAMGAYDYRTIDHIIRWSDNVSLPPKLILALILQECGGNGTWIPLDLFGDNGDSAGPLQINRVHAPNFPGWPQSAMGFDGLVRSLDYMLTNRWAKTFTANGGWPVYARNQIEFIETVIPKMQGSIPWKDFPGYTYPGTLAAVRYGQADLIYDVYWKIQAELSPSEPNEDAQNLSQQLETVRVEIGEIINGLNDIILRASWQRDQMRKIMDRISSKNERIR
jgi:hypothetical protein